MVNSVVVVLGASLRPSGEASPAMRRRVLSGCELALLKDADILLSGGVTRFGVRKSEADVMAEIALEYGLEDARIFTESAARNTMENAQFCKKMIEKKSWSNIWVVSERYHLWRTRLAFHAFGVEAQFFPAKQPDRRDGAQILAYMREVPALIWYQFQILRGYHKKE